ncbi:hypothetical protein [Weissella cibaria]|uniref:hypothetical protein n=1 Tax=Weissella cibaria TaxID=137591 RepID=UPI00143031D1|nr:hypothetical protein [Weissella cibaria]
MAIGIVHVTVGVVIPWTLPSTISGFLATGSHISDASADDDNWKAAAKPLIGRWLAWVLSKNRLFLTCRRQ